MVYKANKQCAPLVFHTLAFYKRSLDTRNANFKNNSNKVCCHLIHAWSHKNCIDYHIRLKAKIVGDHKSNIWYVWIRSNNRWHIYVSVYIGLWLILRRGRHELTYFPIQLDVKGSCISFYTKKPTNYWFFIKYVKYSVNILMIY